MDQHDLQPLDVLRSKPTADKITRRRMLRVAALAGLSGAAIPRMAAASPGTAVGGRARANAQASSAAGEVRFLIAEAFWANWHPYSHTAQIQRRIEQQVFDPLIRNETDDFSVYSPALAESWQQLDELTWEFKLRQGVTFHSGQQFTAADVKASLELASGATPEQVVAATRFVPITVEVVDDFTARLTTETPFAPLLNVLATMAILSAEDIAAGTAALEAAPNGTGPFQLVNDEQNVKTMESNPNYWGGAPAIKTLVWEYIQDSQTRLNALLAGQAHVIDRVPPEHLPALQASPDAVLLSTTGFEVVSLLIRQDAPPPWDNPKVRQAVAWSIDREALVTNLVGGASEVARSHIPNHAVYAVPQEPAYTFDPEQAKALLAEAGFTDEGPEIDLWGTTGFLPRSKEVVEAMADGLMQNGFRPKVTITDVAGIVDALATKGERGLMFHLSWSSNGDPHEAVNFIYHSSPDNVLGFDYPEVDDLIDRGAAATDPEERASIYEQLQARLWQNVMNLPLYNSDFTIAHLKRLSGIKTLPNFMTYFNQASLEG